MQRQGKELLQRQRAAALDQAPEGRPLEMLDHHVRVGAIEHRAEAADDHRVGEPLQRLCLAAQVAQRLLVLGLVWPQDLGDHDRVEVPVPDEQRLAAAAPAQRFQHAPAGGDLRAFREEPTRPHGAETHAREKTHATCRSGRIPFVVRVRSGERRRPGSQEVERMKYLLAIYQRRERKARGTSPEERQAAMNAWDSFTTEVIEKGRPPRR